MAKRIYNKEIEFFNYLRLLCLILFCANFKSSIAQIDNIANKLVEYGYENVRSIETINERIFTIEDNVNRLSGVGIAKAIEIIQKSPEFKNDKTCKIIITKLNVPQIALSYTPKRKSVKTEIAPKDWQVQYELGDAWDKVKKEKKKNSSLFKADILVYPQLAFKNVIVTQVYQVLFDLSPAVEVSLLPGMKFTGQIRIPIYNDGYGANESKVHPGFITLSQRFRIPGNIFGKVTAGFFNSDRYGMDFSFQRPFKDERFSVEGRASVLGVGYWNGFKLHCNSDMRFHWSLGTNFYWNKFNTLFKLQAQRFLMGETGVRFDMIRHFRYASVGLYAMKAKEANINGGFRFQVALPPYKYKRYKNKYIPRINTSSNMGVAYNAGNERYYYREFRSECSDNIMENNSLNPYFIKSELLNQK